MASPDSPTKASDSTLDLPNRTVDPPRKVRFSFGAQTHPGKKRENNEDHFLVSRVSRNQEILLTNLPQDHLPEQTGDDGYLFIVADGMGGMAAGEVASRLAIS